MKQLPLVDSPQTHLFPPGVRGLPCPTDIHKSTGRLQDTYRDYRIYGAAPRMPSIRPENAEACPKRAPYLPMNEDSLHKPLCRTRAPRMPNIDGRFTRPIRAVNSSAPR